MKNTKMERWILAGVFCALTVVGTSIRIPILGAFIHLGNAMLLLAVLFLGYKLGALAGGLGFAIFDILNGYAAEAPYFILESFVVGFFAILVVHHYHNDLSQPSHLLQVTLAAGIAKLIMTFLKNVVRDLFIGTTLNVAIIDTLSTKMLSTVINTASTIVIVMIVYYPLKRALTRLNIMQA